MKCPNCKTEMEKGSLGSNGAQWGKGTFYTTASVVGNLVSNVMSKTLVIAWKCPSCQKIELIAEK